MNEIIILLYSLNFELSTKPVLHMNGAQALEQFTGFGISAAASAIGATAVYPVDVVKTRLQNQTKDTKIYSGGLDCFKQILQKEGPFRLYSGLVPYMTGQVPEKAIRLFVVNQVRSVVHLAPFGKKLSKKQQALVAEILAGSAAGTCQVAITNPMEVIKVRMQVFNQSADKLAQKPGMISMLRELGFRGMYKGASACFLRDVPFSGIYFPVYFLSKSFFADHLSRPLSSWALLVSATFAG